MKNGTGYKALDFLLNIACVFMALSIIVAIVAAFVYGSPIAFEFISTFENIYQKITLYGVYAFAASAASAIIFTAVYLLFDNT